MPANRTPETEDVVPVAIRRAISLLSDSDSETRDSVSPENVIWKATEEAEYAAFRISMVHSLADHVVKIRLPNPTPSARIDEDGARKLFEESLRLLETDVTGAYERLRVGIALLRRSQSRPLETRSESANTEFSQAEK